MNNKFEEFRKKIKDKRITLLGTGVSNMAAARFLSSLGAVITARDKNEAPTYTPDGEGGADVPVKPILEKLGIKTVFGCDYLSGIDGDMIIKTPGIRCDISELLSAEKKGAVITSEAELFCMLCPCRIYAVTGSDGKTTTTTLIYKMLSEERSEGRIYLGGNIGVPLLPLVRDMNENDKAVLELSSFQLHNMSFSPYRALITNITPNHLNWHKDMDEYAEAKARIFAFQDDTCRLVLNAESDYTEKFIKRAKCPVTLFSSGKIKDGTDAVYLDGDDIIRRKDGVCKKIISSKDILIPGIHNVENYMAAIAMTEGDVTDETVLKIARTFSGVRHRIEKIREKDGVTFYNSSIDTTPSRTVSALNAFGKKLIVICGGASKNLPLDTLADALMKKAKFVSATGDTGREIYTMLRLKGFPENSLSYNRDFEKAVLLAASVSGKGDVVILSPASASFDSFRNFERRGDRFRDIINNL